MISTRLQCPAVLVKQRFGWGVQSPGLIKPGLGHSYSRIFSNQSQVQNRSCEEHEIYLHGNKKNHFMSIDSQLASLWNRGLGQLGNGIVTTTETIRGMVTNFQRNDFWVRLGGQALVVIGRWCSGQPGTNHRLSLSTHKIPEIQRLVPIPLIVSGAGNGRGFAWDWADVVSNCTMGLFWGTKIRALDVTKDDSNYIGVERQKSIVMRFRLQPNKNFVAALVFVSI